MFEKRVTRGHLVSRRRLSVTKTRLIAQREYLYYVRKRSFQFFAFGIPVIIAIVFAIIIALIVNYTDEVDTSGNIHYGYVDNASGGVVSEEVAQNLHNNLSYGQKNSFF